MFNIQRLSIPLNPLSPKGTFYIVSIMEDIRSLNSTFPLPIAIGRKGGRGSDLLLTDYQYNNLLFYIIYSKKKITSTLKLS